MRDAFIIYIGAIIGSCAAIGRCLPDILCWVLAGINTLEELRAMPEWTETNPLRVVTGYHQLARRFFAKHGFQHVVLLTADGALEAAPLMGSADIILDLISTGITLRENNLKQLEGAEVLRSQGVLVASRRYS